MAIGPAPENAVERLTLHQDHADATGEATLKRSPFIDDAEAGFAGQKLIALLRPSE
jgi:hypothetical protein